MKWLSIILLACLPLALAGAWKGLARDARAQDPAPAAARLALEDPPADAEDPEELFSKRSHPAIGLSQIAWLAGPWEGSALGGQVEEVWLKPSGGSMTGMFRLVQREQAGFHQFMLLEEREGRTWLRMQHVNPGYTPWEKNGPLVFELVEADDRHAVFESPDPKQIPSRMTYQTVSTKGMSVKIESSSTLGGPTAFEALYERAVL